jgi:hypothetical protein
LFPVSLQGQGDFFNGQLSRLRRHLSRFSMDQQQKFHCGVSVSPAIASPGAIRRHRSRQPLSENLGLTERFCSQMSTECQALQADELSAHPKGAVKGMTF